MRIRSSLIYSEQQKIIGSFEDGYFCDKDVFFDYSEGLFAV